MRGKIKLVRSTKSEPREWSKDELRQADLYWDWICGKRKGVMVNGKLILDGQARQR